VHPRAKVIGSRMWGIDWYKNK